MQPLERAAMLLTERLHYAPGATTSTVPRHCWFVHIPLHPATAPHPRHSRVWVEHAVGAGTDAGWYEEVVVRTELRPLTALLLELKAK
jgi:hypothetical protein